jgi:hypothetical protein
MPIESVTIMAPQSSTCFIERGGWVGVVICAL